MNFIQLKPILATGVVALGLCLLPQVATAKKVYSPIVKQGELELETQNEIFRSQDPTKNNNSKYQLELSYGLTEQWQTGVYAVYEKKAGSSFQYSQSKWANVIQLTDTGKYWLDIGLYAEYIWNAPRLKKSDVLELKVLFEKPIEQWKHTLNLTIKQALWGKNTLTGLSYAWRSSYQMDSGLEPAIEVYGGLGTVNKLQFSKQEHLIGPTLAFDIVDDLEVDFGWLMSTREGAAYGDFKLNLEYEF